MKLEINTRKKTEWKNMSRLNNMLLNNKQIKEEIDNYLETNKIENTTFQNLWDAAKAVPGGKFITIQAYLKK